MIRAMASTIVMSAAPSLSQDTVLAALFVVRVAFPVILLAISLSLYTAKKDSVNRHSETPIVPVTIAVKSPRRGLILPILTLVALTYFLDGFALIVHSVLSKHWQGTPPTTEWWKSLWSGIEVATVGGLLAAGLLAVFGVWKEMQGVAVWLVRRPRVWAGIALVGSFAEVGLLGVALGTVYNKRECFFSVFSFFVPVPSALQWSWN